MIIVVYLINFVVFISSFMRWGSWPDWCPKQKRNWSWDACWEIPWTNFTFWKWFRLHYTCWEYDHRKQWLFKV